MCLNLGVTIKGEARVNIFSTANGTQENFAWAAQYANCQGDSIHLEDPVTIIGSHYF